MKIIPAIDLRGGHCVRLYQGQFDQQTTYDIEPVDLAGTYAAMGFDDLHVVDLDGARSGRQENRKIIRRIVDASQLRVQLGGGIRTQSELESCLIAGVSRVIVGSLAVTRPGTVQGWLKTFGPEKIVVALDVTIGEDGVPRVATHGWTRSSQLTLWQCLNDYISAGLENVLCTDISRDGALTGPNLGLYRQLIDKYPAVQLQASGGVRYMNDLRALRDIGAAAAISGRALLDGRISAAEIESFLLAA